VNATSRILYFRATKKCKYGQVLYNKAEVLDQTKRSGGNVQDFCLEVVLLDRPVEWPSIKTNAGMIRQLGHDYLLQSVFSSLI
jgi:hypothetical protein